MDCPYYHGGIDGAEAESRLMRDNGQDGAFLIRNSGSTKGVYILCLFCKSERKVYQYRILTDKNKKMYIESAGNLAVRQNSSLSELVEHCLSRGSHNGLKTSLGKGVRPDGMESSDSESEDDMTYVDTKYIFSSDREAPDAIPGHLSRGAKAASSHIYAEPGVQHVPRVSKETRIKAFYSDQFARVDSSRVTPEFARKVQLYVENDMVTEAMDMTKPESKLSASHLHKLKNIIKDETVTMQRQLTEFLGKLDFLRDVVARPGTDPRQNNSADIAGESPFTTLVGLLSLAKQDLCALEMEAVNSYNEVCGYANVDPLALKRPKHPAIPVAVFQVRSGGKAILSGPSPLSLKVDVQKGQLCIVKESSQTFDSSNVFGADKIIQVVKSTNNTRMLEILVEGRRKETYYFDGIRQREHFCQLIQQLKKVHTMETVVDNISLFCGTWNMGNELPPQLGLHSWIKSQGMGKTRIDALASEPHDLYAIGTQEARVSERDWVNKVKRLLHNQFSIDFHLIRLVIFTKPEHKNRISKVQQAVVRTGIANALGNKGAATISLNFDGTSLCFICCHLAANRERLARRNQNSRDIIKNLSSSIGSKAYADFDVTNQFNHVFCMGDLNYRVDGDIKPILQMAEDAEYAEMLKLDQLLNTINERNAFFGFDEEVITFPPTYRYHKQAVNTFNWRKVKKSGIKINAPSWCDRVIWKSLPNCAITNTSYGTVQDIQSSDHKPVFASFTIAILPQNIGRSVNSITTPIDIKVLDLSCEVNTVHSEKQADYFITIMGSCLEAPSQSQRVKSTQISEDVEAAEWDETLSLKPSFSDASHLQTQHILIAVKSEADGMVMGDTAVSLLEIFQSHGKECPFVCDLTSLGGRTGSLRGVMKAILKDSGDSHVRKISSSVVVNDIYATPLCNLNWDDPTPTLTVPDSMPRIQGRPMSFVSGPSKSGSKQFVRVLPPIPHAYDVPRRTEPKDLMSFEETDPSPYYNSVKVKPVYYNVGISEPKHAVLSPPAKEDNKMALLQLQSSVTSDEEELYEEAEVVAPPLPAPLGCPAIPARAEPIKPRNSLHKGANENQPQLSDPSANQGTADPVTAWLLGLSMPQYVAVFKLNKWTTLELVSQLSKDQLTGGGVKMQHVFRLIDAIRNL